MITGKSAVQIRYGHFLDTAIPEGLKLFKAIKLYVLFNIEADRSFLHSNLHLALICYMHV